MRNSITEFVDEALGLFEVCFKRLHFLHHTERIFPVIDYEYKGALLPVLFINSVELLERFNAFASIADFLIVLDLIR